MDEENRNGQNKRILTALAEMLKKGRNGRGRQNLLGKKLSYRDWLPIKLEQKGNEQILSFDLNQMPHVSITGGTSECQANVIRKILKDWECQSFISPVVLDLSGTLAPETAAISEGMLISRLYEMMSVLERRYDELSIWKFKNTREYLNQGHNDMPFHPVILFAFEKMSGSRFWETAESLICHLAQRGRSVGINLILCSADAKIMKGVLDCNFPAKLTFLSNDEKDFLWDNPWAE